MSEKEKKKKNKDIKLKSPTEASAEIGFVLENPVENVSELTIYETEWSGDPELGIHWTITQINADDGTETKEELKEDLKLTNVYTEDAKFIESFHLSTMRERLANGETLPQICGDIKNFIITNKDSNPDMVQRAIATLLGDAEDHYDGGTDNWLGISGYTRKHQGDSAQEILGKILNTPEGEEIPGFVCSTIHEFGMRLLDECGIKAAMLAGGTKASNHTCLLWQRSDGKYVQSNYGKSYTLEASNIKDAAREVYKRNLGLINNGYIYLIDNGGSYQEFAMKEEAVWGEEFDKRAYNNQSVFDHSVASQPSIDGKVNVSNLGSVSAEVKGTLAYGNDKVSKETSYSLGFKRSTQTSLADNSTSVGFKLEHNSEKLINNGKKFTETKFMADYTELSTDKFTAKRDYMPVLDHYEFSDPEQVARIREWVCKDYEMGFPIEEYQYAYDHCQKYLGWFDKYNKNISSPITKEEFIEEQKETYVSGDNIPFNELTDSAKENALNVIGQRWEDYLINNYYNEAKDIMTARLNNYKDHIDNYDKYKNEYVDNFMYECYQQVYRGKDEFKDVVECKSIKTTNLSLFFKRAWGMEKTLLKDKGVELTHGFKLSGMAGFNDVLTATKYTYTAKDVDGKSVVVDNIETEGVFSSFGGDVRLAAEDGLKFDLYNKTSMFSTAVSAGVTADMSLKSGTLTPSVYPGFKLNGSSMFQKRINENASFSAGVSGYSEVTKPSIDYGASLQVQASYKPSNKDITIFGSANFGIEKQRIRIGGFNELTENSRTLGVSVGTQLGKKTTVTLNYNGKFDKLNSTRNRSVVSVGAKINL